MLSSSLLVLSEYCTRHQNLVVFCHLCFIYLGAKPSKLQEIWHKTKWLMFCNWYALLDFCTCNIVQMACTTQPRVRQLQKNIFNSVTWQVSKAQKDIFRCSCFLLLIYWVACMSVCCTVNYFRYFIIKTYLEYF